MNEIILAVESSCDETAISIIEIINSEKKSEAVRILAHEVESQHASHGPFGGVVPEIAARDHLAKIYDIANTALKKADLKSDQLTKIAVTMGPGLIGALMVGVLFARGLATALNIPLIAVNHVDAHLAPALLLPNFSPKTDLKKLLNLRTPTFPAIALTVSGGHCHLSYLSDIKTKKILGTTLDDACGEAFDKVAKLLGLEYPGGPEIEKLALVAEQNGFSDNYQFPFKLSDKENIYQFSYSGIKTAVMEIIRKETGIKKGKITGKDLPFETKQQIAYSFQIAALKQLHDRVANTLKNYPDVKSIFIAGGVAQNKKFRELFSNFQQEVVFASPALCSDNATMIALQTIIEANIDGFQNQPFPKYVTK
ncbi:tRNA (adenosine(37)-N6)-threonylcarbamoyltransferase complex transferase subunit TsaD [Pigmentibacter sp. JX0631]|uniref:tRNA (adenosine(37)-N6)-threonylcarbamoyltransferase complex transferase subunit TsaD n=1 Tax=Pigmentibacter sp. JX0631 TaxID=2976982 RepID=UPI002468277D|nr:tRNA (adenosine(37)-N6)-threonylcarbamoyltransferase complex transferase subunit TsaD [Pigmentibacter sp. JX0631]WGL58634.1 tRNA (adenosine(37)-N6)-threonylcarbamoyltransferase complex transferase subunit TsaD [Pigmentibacter sp. JX0631]